MQIRVYDNRGDFLLDLPENVEITFGYFNQASAGSTQRNHMYDDRHGAVSAMKTTALRIYEKKGKTKTQIAVFCGVQGYRRMDIGLKKIVQKVMVEHRIDDDEENGMYEATTRSKRQFRAML